MKFKILDIKETGVDLKVIIATPTCGRRVFSLDKQLAKDNKWLEEIKRILKEEEQAQVVKVKDKEKFINKEFEV